MNNSKYENLKKVNKLNLFNPKIVSIGGGTGLSAMLRGIKRYTSDITAVVTVADDGGGSGMLRNDLNMPPPGDIRNCIVALSEAEPIMQELLMYRFGAGVLSGQNFGNLLVAAMTGIFDGDFVQAVRNVCSVINITGKVYPVTASDVELIATLENGKTVIGESDIGHSVRDYKSSIKKVRLRSKVDTLMPIEPLEEILEEIRSADLITLGPGSLYTSILPNLVIGGLKEAILNSNAPVVYINNIMTQPGETDDYTAFDHCLAIIDHTYDDFIDYCIVNTGEIVDDLAKKYRDDGACQVKFDKERFNTIKMTVIERDVVTVDKNGFVRHDADALADTLLDILNINRNVDGQEISSEGVLLYRPKNKQR